MTIFLPPTQKMKKLMILTDKNNTQSADTLSYMTLFETFTLITGFPSVSILRGSQGLLLQLSEGP